MANVGKRDESRTYSNSDDSIPNQSGKLRSTSSQSRSIERLGPVMFKATSRLVVVGWGIAFD